MAEYVLATDADDTERRRMALLFAYHGPSTIEALDATGVSGGWRCLEVGAGGGDVSRWVADRVRPNGSVTAVDLETAWLEPFADDIVHVVRGDFTDLDLGDDRFDLVVAQMLLLHLPDPGAACRRFVQLARGAGEIVVHDTDFRPVALADASPLEAEGLSVMTSVMQAAGIDLSLGPKVVRLLEAAGATIEQVETRPCQDAHDARLAAEITAITIERFRTRASVSDDAITAALAALRDRPEGFTGPTRWVVRARAPE